MKLEYSLLQKNSKKTILICTALGSSFHEWEPVLKSFPKECSVLLYNRAGYGKSPVVHSPRTPKNIAQELNELVSELLPDSKIILVGHSFGGLVAEQFARDFSKNVQGVVFLDPATTEEDRFSKELTKKEFKKSGIDKSFLIQQGIFAGKIGLLKLFKPLFKKSIPFYYNKEYSESATQEILDHLTKACTYKTMKEEYAEYLKCTERKNELLENPFPKVPISLLLHDPKILVEEIEQFGGATRAEAEKVESLWKEIMVEHYKNLGSSQKIEVCSGASHYIHLTSPEVLQKHLEFLI